MPCTSYIRDGFIELLKNDGTAKRIRYNINDLEKELEPCDFVRIHPLELVNCDYIFRIKNGKIMLDNGTELAIADPYRENILEKFGEI